LEAPHDHPVELSDPERATLLQCLNAGVEPPAELAAKRFPSVCGSWDFLKESGPTWATGWKNMIVQGDNLQFLKTCFLDQDPLVKGKITGKVKLVYMDPPFATQADFQTKDGEDRYRDKAEPVRTQGSHP